MPVGAPLDLGHVGQRLAVQKIRMVQLDQELRDLVLGRPLHTEALRRYFRYLLHAAAAIHEAKHEVGGRRNAEVQS
jgi:hypothetical protein